MSLRWSVVGVPKEAMLIFDATVQVRYGLDQAGAEIGYNPAQEGAALAPPAGRLSGYGRLRERAVESGQ